MKTTIVLTILSCWAMFSCNNSDSSKKPDGNNQGQQSTLVPKQVPDEVCNQGPAANRLEGSWTITLESPNMIVINNMNFQNDTFTLNQICVRDQLKVPVQASSEIKVTSKDFEILEEKSASDEKFLGKQSLKCSFKLEKMKLEYQFRGSCLLLKSPSGEILKLARGGAFENPQPRPPQPNQPPKPQPEPKPLPPEQPPRTPNPSPTPAPGPSPAPKTQMACIAVNLNSAIPYLGIATTGPGAQLKASNDCTMVEGDSKCRLQFVCSIRSVKKDVFKCGVLNTKTNKTFTSSGSSKAEALYEAQMQCLQNSDMESLSCTIQENTCVIGLN